MKYGLLILLLGSLAACGGGEKANIELIQDMMVSPAYKAQDENPNNPNGSSMLVPPANTLPIGHKRYPYGPADFEKAGRELKNPTGEISAEMLERGRNRYEIYCGVCHGMNGGGESPVAEKMPVRPPSLLTPQVKKYRDGTLYHFIMQGKGVMGSYANQVTKESDRWAIVNYIRNLQKLAN